MDVKIPGGKCWTKTSKARRPGQIYAAMGEHGKKQDTVR